MRENKRDSKNVPSNTKSFAEDEFSESLLKALAMYLRLFEEGKRERESSQTKTTTLLCALKKGGEKEYINLKANNV